MTHLRTTFPLIVSLAALLIGCGDVQEQELAKASVTSALQTSRSAGVGTVVYEALDESTCLDPETAAAEAAARPVVGLYPSECAQKTHDGPSLHLELDDCTGPFGRVLLEGGLDAALRPVTCAELHADVSDSGDLTANGRDVEYSASADITAEGTRRDVTWSAHWATTTKLGKEIAQTSDLAIVIDTTTSCLAIDGTAAGYVGDHDFNSQIEGLTVCPDACPTAGTVRIQAEGWRRERSLVLEFDGSETAKVTGSDGDTFDVSMVCSGDEE